MSNWAIQPCWKDDVSTMCRHPVRFVSCVLPTWGARHVRDTKRLLDNAVLREMPGFGKGPIRTGGAAGAICTEEFAGTMTPSSSTGHAPDGRLPLPRM